MSTWYLNRLKTMSFAEILFRIFQSCQKQYELLLYKRISPSSELLNCHERIISPNLTSINSDNSTFDIFGKEFVYNENEIDWHRDIFSGETFPVVFSKKINIRINPKASAKNVWEINRLQFLVQIAINYRSTGQKNYLTQFIKILISWIDRNPYLQGINWYSNIEVNIRLINWFFCWEILDVENLSLKDEQFKAFVEKKWIPTIYQHCIYSRNNPSRFSSANNHLISEYAGLFIASSKWEFKESGKWIKYAQKGLENEIIKQHSENGINKEEAAEYIQFITDFFLLSFIVGERTNRPFSEQYKQILHKIFRYIFDFLDCNGNFPKYGDEDDGKCFILDFSKKFNNFKSLLTSSTIIFNDQVLKSKSNSFDIKNHFLFGNRGKEVFELVPDINYIESSEFYKEEGHFIFRKHENAKEIYLHFDAAPLGFLSIAAHGHADALSFILHVAGLPIFIDSGTYTYHTEADWRRYFIGTLAHNTVCINHKDQALNGGPTLWLKHYETSITDLERSDSVDRVKATHNGYLKEDAQHIREIVFDKQINEFQVVDTIVVWNNKKTQVEIPFHFHPEVAIAQLSSDSYMISRNSTVKMQFSVDEKLVPVIINGQMKPNILGWYSDSFLNKEATSVIFCKTEIVCTTIFKFIIKIF
jgi:hypothetical protein